jgi:alcohol dehydrogenase class IV
VTQHAIFLDREVNVKKAVASSVLLPNVAIIDPMLTVSCPPHVTASSGLDAFIHSAEPFLSKNANPITDAIALDAISIITRWLGPAFADGTDLEARYYMALGSLMSGMVLSNAGTSLVHAMAYPIGGEHHTPHGVSLSGLMLACFDYIAVAREEKMALLAEAMGEPIEGLAPREVVPQALAALRHLINSVNLPASLGELGIDREKTDIRQWAIDAHKEQRLLSRSPRVLSVEDIETIYANAFGQ